MLTERSKIAKERPSYEGDPRARRYASGNALPGSAQRLTSKGVSNRIRRSGRVAEGAPLLREYTLIAYRGFESLLLRHINKDASIYGGVFVRVSK